MHMSTDTKQGTEQRILETARLVFLRRGYHATSMSDIAEAMGISRSALNYYFRSKERLFEAVFLDQLEQFIPQLSGIITSDLPLETKIEGFVHSYLDILKRNRDLPHFMMTELNRDPERILERIRLSGLFSPEAQKKVKGQLQELNPKLPLSQLLLNLVSMCIFPFVVRPIVAEFLGDGSAEAFEDYIDERKTIIVETIARSLRPSREEDCP